ncbi:hypothetical protein GJ496_008142 [Pomphorhynchus laevis]|nr:hypothetical protein GJ496_008142 [Pomphorhynchus laevis]
MSTNSDKLDMILHDMVINRTCGLHISRWQLFTGFILSTYNLFYSWCLFSFHFTWDNLYMCAIPPNVSLADAIPATNDTLFNKCNVYELFNKSYSNKTIPCPIGYNHTMYDQRKTFASTVSP